MPINFIESIGLAEPVAKEGFAATANLSGDARSLMANLDQLQNQIVQLDQEKQNVLAVNQVDAVRTAEQINVVTEQRLAAGPLFNLKAFFTGGPTTDDLDMQRASLQDNLAQKAMSEELQIQGMARQQQSLSAQQTYLKNRFQLGVEVGAMQTQVTTALATDAANRNRMQDDAIETNFQFGQLQKFVSSGKYPQGYDPARIDKAYLEGMAVRQSLSGKDKQSEEMKIWDDFGQDNNVMKRALAQADAQGLGYVQGASGAKYAKSVIAGKVADANKTIETSSGAMLEYMGAQVTLNSQQQRFAGFLQRNAASLDPTVSGMGAVLLGHGDAALTSNDPAIQSQTTQKMDQLMDAQIEKWTAGVSNTQQKTALHQFYKTGTWQNVDQNVKHNILLSNAIGVATPELAQSSGGIIMGDIMSDAAARVSESFASKYEGTTTDILNEDGGIDAGKIVALIGSQSGATANNSYIWFDAMRKQDANGQTVSDRIKERAVGFTLGQGLAQQAVMLENNGNAEFATVIRGMLDPQTGALNPALYSGANANPVSNVVNILLDTEVKQKQAGKLAANMDTVGMFKARFQVPGAEKGMPDVAQSFSQKTIDRLHSTYGPEMQMLESGLFNNGLAASVQNYIDASMGTVNVANRQLQMALNDVAVIKQQITAGAMPPKTAEMIAIELARTYPANIATQAAQQIMNKPDTSPQAFRR